MTPKQTAGHTPGEIFRAAGERADKIEKRNLARDLGRAVLNNLATQFASLRAERAALKAQNEELAAALREMVRTAKTCEAWNGVALDYNAAIERARALLSRLNDKGEGR